MTAKTSRLHSIDIVRGLVMVIMAIDHVRDYFYNPGVSSAADLTLNPTNPATTTPLLFFTRWITHLCAPTFLLLTGVSACLVGQRKTKKELSSYLFKRGLFIVAMEVIVITLAWTFNPLYNVIILQVMWAIGISMICLSALVYLSSSAVFVIGLIIFAGHNILNFLPKPPGNFITDAIYYSEFSMYSPFRDHIVLVVYAFLPWLGIMLMGYSLGHWFAPSVDPAVRKKRLLYTGVGFILFFIALRALNVYGDPSPWSTQSRGPLYTFFSFMNTTKYPPSLLFATMGIGPMLILLSQLERPMGRVSRVLNVFGRVPMFYYIAHLYLIHIIVVIAFYMQGFTSKDIITPNSPFLFKPPAFGVGLGPLYAIWALVIILLYPLCAWYNRYKASHHQWWLKYL